MPANNRLFDDLAKVMTSAAGAASGLRQEMEVAFRSQIERFMADMDLVTREEFDAMKELAVSAADEAANLRAELDAVTARLDALEAATKPARKPRAKKPASSGSAENVETS